MRWRNVIPREMQVPKGAVKVADKQSDAVAYLYPAPHNGKPAAVVFLGKSDKALWRHYFKNEHDRERRISGVFAGRREEIAAKAARRAERTAWVPDYKVGEILHTSWGYEQTNIEYFQITQVKGKYVWLRQIASDRTETNFMSGTCTPKKDAFLSPRYEGDDTGVTIRRLAQRHGIKIDDVRTAYRGSDKPLHWSSYH